MLANKINIRKIIKFLLLTGVIGFFAVLTLSSFEQVKEIEARKVELESEILAEKKKTQELGMENNYHETDEFIEKVAREKLGFVMPDEIVFIKKETAND